MVLGITADGFSRTTIDIKNISSHRPLLLLFYPEILQHVYVAQ